MIKFPPINLLPMSSIVFALETKVLGNFLQFILSTSINHLLMKYQQDLLEISFHIGCSVTNNNECVMFILCEEVLYVKDQTNVVQIIFKIS